VNQAHYSTDPTWTNEVWGLARMRDDDKFLTCSDDSTLRMWSTSERKCLSRVSLNIDAKGNSLKTKEAKNSGRLRSLAINPNENLIAVGCYDGTLRVVQLNKKTNEMKQINMIQMRKRWIQDLKFSPNGEMLAVGSHDQWIDVYSVPMMKLISKVKKHSSGITHLDWSCDSEYLHSNCQAYELLFFNASQGKQITSGATMLKDEVWDTWTCVLGWPVQGIYRSEWDGSDINMVYRSNTVFDTGYHLLATADDFSKVRLYRYPCLKKNSEEVIGNGHSSHVTNVSFNLSDTYLYSTGGEDQCVMQWRVTKQ
jgi:WD40 repeat protein